MKRLALSALAIALFGACFNPTFNNPTCGPNGECPSGTTCVQNVCREDGADIDAPIDTSSTDPDAMVDSAVDAPTDAPNDGTPIDSPIDGTPIDSPTMTCPNGIQEGSEECDDNNSINTDDCTGQCRFNICGDTFTDNVGGRTDTCDDGNASNSDNCVGISIGGLINCRPSSCGDGFFDMASPGIEGCDDVNNISGDGCSSSCAIESGYQCAGIPSVCTPVCGDGIIVSPETCDDHNNNACGTCTANCTNVVPPRAATGSIQCALGNTQQEGETFTLNDGFHPPITFEWDRDGVTTPPRVPVMYQNSFGQGQMADAVTTAVNSVPTSGLYMSAVHTGGPTATITHDIQSAIGNRPITHTVTNGQFVVTGMSGGAAGDCPAGIQCNQNADCASGLCTGGTCQ